MFKCISGKFFTSEKTTCISLVHLSFYPTELEIKGMTHQLLLHKDWQPSLCQTENVCWAEEPTGEGGSTHRGHTQHRGRIPPVSGVALLSFLCFMRISEGTHRSLMNQIHNSFFFFSYFDFDFTMKHLHT